MKENNTSIRFYDLHTDGTTTLTKVISNKKRRSKYVEQAMSNQGVTQEQIEELMTCPDLLDCPDCKGDCGTGNFISGPFYPCKTCNGTGKEI